MESRIQLCNLLVEISAARILGNLGSHLVITIWHNDTHYPFLSLSLCKKGHLQLYSNFLRMRVNKMVMYLPFGKKCHIVVSYPSYPYLFIWRFIECRQSFLLTLDSSGLIYGKIRRISELSTLFSKALILKLIQIQDCYRFL